MNLNSKRELESKYSGKTGEGGRFQIHIKLLNYGRIFSQASTSDPEHFRIYCKVIYYIKDLISYDGIQHMESHNIMEETEEYSEYAELEFYIASIYNTILEYLTKPLGELPMFINEDGLIKELVNWRITLPQTPEQILVNEKMDQ